MMDQNVFQLVTGMTSVERIGQEFRSKAPFAQFDVLAPDETGLAWQIARRLLSVPHKFLTSRVGRKSSDAFESGIQVSAQ